MEQATCQVCGEQRCQPYFKRRDRFGDQVFQYVRCARCGEVYLNPRPALAEIAAFYPDEYESYETIENASSRLQQKLWWKNQEKVLSYVERFAGQRGQLLDVGCSTGQFLRVAREHGWAATGIELVEPVAEIARTRYQLNVYTGDLDQAPLQPHSFDLITMWDVLEHLHAPRAALERINTLLKPNGILAVGFPNMDAYDRRIFGPAWIGWDAPRHLYIFSQPAFRRLFAETGFDLVARRCLTGGKGSFFLSLDFALQGNKNAAWVQKTKPVLSMLLWPYRQWAYAANKGPGITLIARKQPGNAWMTRFMIGSDVQLGANRVSPVGIQISGGVE